MVNILIELIHSLVHLIMYNFYDRRIFQIYKYMELLRRLRNIEKVVFLELKQERQI